MMNNPTGLQGISQGGGENLPKLYLTETPNVFFCLSPEEQMDLLNEGYVSGCNPELTYNITRHLSLNFGLPYPNQPIDCDDYDYEELILPEILLLPRHLVQGTEECLGVDLITFEKKYQSLGFKKLPFRYTGNHKHEIELFKELKIKDPKSEELQFYEPILNQGRISFRFIRSENISYAVKGEDDISESGHPTPISSITKGEEEPRWNK